MKAPSRRDIPGEENFYLRGGTSTFLGQTQPAWRHGAIAHVRDYASRSTIIESILNRTAENLVGPHGPRPTFANIASDLNRERLEAVWEEFAEDPAVNGAGQDWASLLQSLVRSYCTDGRVFAVMRHSQDFKFGVAVMPLTRDWLVDVGFNGEAKFHVGDLVYEAVNGVVRRPSGKISHYVFYKDSESPQRLIQSNKFGSSLHHLSLETGSGTEYVVLPKNMVCDFFLPKAASDFDGDVSPIYSNMKMAEAVEVLDTSMVRSMQSASKNVGFLERDIGSPTIKQVEENPDQPPVPDQHSYNEIHPLPQGWRYSSFDTSVPNDKVVNYRKALLMNIATGSGSDYAGITGDLEKVNYSSIRHGMVQARDSYAIKQKALEARVCKPVLTSLLLSAHMSGRLPLPISTIMKASMSEWRHRTWEWVDPQKDLQAEQIACELGTNSPQRICESRGRDFKEVMKENEEAARLAFEIRQKYPKPGEEIPKEEPDEENSKVDSMEDDAKDSSDADSM